MEDSDRYFRSQPEYTIKMAKESETTETIYASEATGCKFCVSSEDGQILYERIKEALLEGNKVLVSFRDVFDISSAFMDAAVGQLYRGDFSKEELCNKLTLQGLSDDDSFLLERVIIRAKYYCGEPDQLDAAVCELLGEEK